MRDLTRYQQGPVNVVVSRDGDDLAFLRSEEDFGRSTVSESRMRGADFVARGEGPLPWYALLSPSLDVALPGGTQPVEAARPQAVARDGGDSRRARRVACAGTRCAVGVVGARRALCEPQPDVVVDIVEILRAGGTEVTNRHLQNAARAGASQVEFALRR